MAQTKTAEARTDKMQMSGGSADGNGKHFAKLIDKTGNVMLPTRIDLSEKQRESMIALINQQLADTFDLLSQTKQAHWNVKGPYFIGLHKLFDEFAEGLEKHVDTIAERPTALGGVALGTARMAAATSRLPEFPAGPGDGMAFVAALADRYAAVAKTTREAIDRADSDKSTADVFTEISRDMDMWLWFLEAHIQE